MVVLRVDQAASGRVIYEAVRRCASHSDGSGQEEPLGASGRHHYPGGLPSTAFVLPSLLTYDGIRSSSLRGALHIRRVKRGTPSTHPILGDELRALRRLRREQKHKSPFVFTSERGASFSTAGFARMVERAGAEAGLGFKAHPHMLRHACGYALANKRHDTRALQAYLGHRNIQLRSAIPSCRRRASKIFGVLNKRQRELLSFLEAVTQRETYGWDKAFSGTEILVRRTSHRVAVLKTQK